MYRHSLSFVFKKETLRDAFPPILYGVVPWLLVLLFSSTCIGHTWKNKTIRCWMKEVWQRHPGARLFFALHSGRCSKHHPLSFLYMCSALLKSFHRKKIYNLINKENALSSSSQILLLQGHLEGIHALVSKVFCTVSRQKHITRLLWRTTLLHCSIKCGRWVAERTFCEMVYGMEYEHT